MPKLKPPQIIVAVVVVLIAALALPRLFTEGPGSRSVEGGIVSEVIGVYETNASAPFDVQMLEGSDPEHESEHMFSALKPVPGVGTASLDTRSLVLTVDYDSAIVNEASIRMALVESGYLVPTSADATAMQLAEDGSVQRLVITDDGGFNPYLIRATAGVPIELEFLPGQDCRSIIKVPAVGIEQNIATGGIVSLPGLAVGEYEILCSGDAQEALIIVE